MHRGSCLGPAAWLGGGRAQAIVAHGAVWSFLHGRRGGRLDGHAAARPLRRSDRCLTSITGHSRLVTAGSVCGLHALLVSSGLVSAHALDERRPPAQRVLDALSRALAPRDVAVGERVRADDDRLVDGRAERTLDLGRLLGVLSALARRDALTHTMRRSSREKHWRLFCPRISAIWHRSATASAALHAATLLIDCHVGRGCWRRGGELCRWCI